MNPDALQNETLNLPRSLDNYSLRRSSIKAFMAPDPFKEPLSFLICSLDGEVVEVASFKPAWFSNSLNHTRKRAHSSGDSRVTAC